ncbi:hypothetical protein [Thiolapillus sp.]|uniref:hypothetical protein n=1 Tax=Thiolapillus sp. TaxID=2017437 RepID=UPI003AF698A6
MVYQQVVMTCGMPAFVSGAGGYDAIAFDTELHLVGGSDGLPVLKILEIDPGMFAGGMGLGNITCQQQGGRQKQFQFFHWMFLTLKKGLRRAQYFTRRGFGGRVNNSGSSPL